ncbi:hypothetical protein PIB30_018641 [Stylosanthes scabra]|uniref:Uncharacterized protein n=1 Tax=Stylosanthes scabra TaxID=79078 RepID=A0ABU6U9Q7_9FABA|nr:hypothetical protein [Stylosanthes scabra]
MPPPSFPLFPPHFPPSLSLSPSQSIHNQNPNLSITSLRSSLRIPSDCARQGLNTSGDRFPSRSWFAPRNNHPCSPKELASPRSRKEESGGGGAVQFLEKEKVAFLASVGRVD